MSKSVSSTPKDCLISLSERLDNLCDRLASLRNQHDYLVNGAKPVTDDKGVEKASVQGDPHIARLVDKASRAQYLVSEIENLLASFRFG